MWFQGEMMRLLVTELHTEGKSIQCRVLAGIYLKNLLHGKVL